MEYWSNEHVDLMMVLQEKSGDQHSCSNLSQKGNFREIFPTFVEIFDLKTTNVIVMLERITKVTRVHPLGSMNVIHFTDIHPIIVEIFSAN